MKKIFIIMLLLPAITIVHAQVLTPVKWQYCLKKIGDKIYEIHLKAVLDVGWHTYSQSTPDGGPLPTHIVFTTDNDWRQIGKIKEIGKLQTKYESAFELNVKYYEDSVDFVQTIKLSRTLRKAIPVSIEYMACTFKQCLSPDTIKFSILIN